MISERQANSVKSDFNPVTGDSLKTKIGNQDAYAKGWEAIFGKKEQWVDEEEKAKFKQEEVENSYKCNIIEQHFLTEPLPENIIGDEL